MDFGNLDELGKNLTVIIPLVLLIVFQIFARKRRTERTTAEIVSSLLGEVNQNQQLMEAFLLRWQFKKFKTASWQRNKNRLDFLSQSAQTALTDAFNQAEDFNRQIDNARKNKSASYLANVNVEKMREPLARSRQRLEEWLQLNATQSGLPRRKQGLFG